MPFDPPPPRKKTWQLPAIVSLFNENRVEVPRRASRPHRERLFAALADMELLYAMHGSKRF